jgi:DNA-binding protein YbaB
MFGNMKEMMKQAQSMKSEMTKIKKELEKVESKALPQTDRALLL